MFIDPLLLPLHFGWWCSTFVSGWSAGNLDRGYYSALNRNATGRGAGLTPRLMQLQEIGRQHCADVGRVRGPARATEWQCLQRGEQNLRAWHQVFSDAGMTFSAAGSPLSPGSESHGLAQRLAWSHRDYGSQKQMYTEHILGMHVFSNA